MKTLIRIDRKTGRMVDLLHQIDWENQVFGYCSFTNFKAYARGYGIKPKELEALYLRMQELKLITVETK
jgi:hypothetical protein